MAMKHMAMKQHLIALSSSTIGLGLLSATLIANPAFAADPFRTSNPKAIGNQTEAAFNALFKEGNYVQASELVKKAEAKESSEPLVYGMKAILAFNNADLGTFESAAKATREKGEQLISSDKLRGNLYASVGSFLEGAAIVRRDGLVKGAPAALGKVQEAFKKLDEAEKVDSKDPELNLVKGAIDLALAVNVKLPLSDSGKAIARLEGAAGPRYIADRSLAWGYRDLKEPTKAMDAIDRALKVTKDNPELHYLKAQIFVKQKNDKTAVEWFEKALSKRSQLPNALATQIEKERNGAKNRAAAAAPTPAPSPSPAKK
jgi:tetratricopeptide (TPR) repeat protein